jgi:serine/threonine protein kinase
MKICSICERCYPDAVDVCVQDGSEEFATAGDGAPDMVPGYILTRRVDISRNAETYEARENTSGSACIVKIFSTPADTDSILREAKAVKSLFDPGLLDVYDSGTIDDGRAFVVSEVADGQSLRQLLTNVGPPALLISVEMIRQAAESLHNLHNAGVTHGALNPENIFLSKGKNGHALVRIDGIDYGRTIEHLITSNKFEIDSHIDRLRYFAPEQCTGDERSPRSDVYALGIIFHELLSGTPPFDSPKAAGLIEKHRNERPPEVKIANFELRMLVTHALSESMQKQPAFRQSSANLLARQLRHIEQLATHSSTPPPAVRNATRDVTRPVVPSIQLDYPPRVEIYEKAEPIVMRKSASESRSVVRQEPVIEQPMIELPLATPEVTTQVDAPASISNQSLPATPKRSRLRSLKRKLNELSAMVAATMERPATPSITSFQPPAEKAPRKIEWVQPEDDIPSIDEVVKVLASEGIEKETPLMEVVAAPAVIQDDAPALETVAEIPAAATAPIEVVAAERPIREQVLPPVVKHAEAEKIAHPELVTVPEFGAEHLAHDPEPTLVAKDADAREVAEAKPTIVPEVVEEKLVLDPKPTAVRAEVAQTKPAVVPEIKSPTPKVTDIKVVIRRPVARAKKARPKPEVVAAAAASSVVQVQKTQPKAIVVTPPQYADGDEEITLVRPPKSRVLIDLEKPRTIYRAPTAFARTPDEIAFQPTLIGGRKEKRTRAVASESPVTESNDGMFAANFGSSAMLAENKYRAMTIGVGCVVLAALFLFANDSASKLFQNVSPGDSVTATATTSDVASDTRTVTPDPEFKPAKASMRASTETAVVEKKREKVAEPKAKTTVEESRPTTAKAKPAEKPKTVDTPRKRAEVESPKPQPRRTKVETPAPTGAPRPRIVRDPRP